MAKALEERRIEKLAAKAKQPDIVRTELRILNKILAIGAKLDSRYAVYDKLVKEARFAGWDPTTFDAVVTGVKEIYRG